MGITRIVDYLAERERGGERNTVPNIDRSSNGVTEAEKGAGAPVGERWRQKKKAAQRQRKKQQQSVTLEGKRKKSHPAKKESFFDDRKTGWLLSKQTEKEPKPLVVWLTK